MHSVSTLTSREIEVLYLLAAGYSSKLIAQKLGIANRTAEKHIQNIYTKLLVPNAPAAATFSIQAQIIDPNKVEVIRTTPAA